MNSNFLPEFCTTNLTDGVGFELNHVCVSGVSGHSVDT